MTSSSNSSLRILAPWLFLATLTCALAAQAGKSSTAASPTRPDWIRYPKSDDSSFLYRVGQATGQPTPEAARAAAYRHALETLSMEILTTLNMEGDTKQLTSRMNIRGAEILGHAVHTESGPQGYSCWVQVSYPRSERNKVLEDVATGRELDEKWRAAQAAFHRGDFGVAQEQLLAALNAPGSRDYISFEPDEVKKMLADTYREQKNYLEARHWFGLRASHRG
jgi:hypothetical protein